MNNQSCFKVFISFLLLAGCGPGQNILSEFASESSIQYESSTFSSVVGTPLVISAPSIVGALTSFGINPALPAGLVFNSVSGAITGTPAAKNIATVYTVSAGTASTNLTILVNSWEQEAFVKAPNAQSADFFGRAIAISGDTLVVGADWEDSNDTSITNGTTASADNSAANSGAVYVFRRSGSTWVQEAFIKAPNTDSNDFFGSAVAISGDTLVVGAYAEDSNQSTITNGTTASSDNSFSDPGAAYIFRRTGTTWAQEAFLKAANIDQIDRYGISVAIDGDTVVVGATEEDSNQTTITNGSTASANDSLLESGAVYVYRRAGVTWSQEAYLKAPNANANDFFGQRVAISGDTLVVSAIQEASNQATITNGAGASSDNSAPNAGAVYVFRRSGSTWTNEAYIKPSNMDSNDTFGASIAVSGDTIAVGAIGESSNQITVTNGSTASSDNSASNSGAVYIFKRTGVNWDQEAYLKAPNAEAGDSFGFSVGLSGNSLVVGARSESSNQTTITHGPSASANNSVSSAGAAYVFKRTGANWVAEAYLKAPVVSTANEFYGHSCSLDGDTVVVGAYNEDSNQTSVTNGATASSDNSAAEAGAAYVYRLDTL